jgi:DNA-directed RNA polymerase specialized sigma24 family protein
VDEQALVAAARSGDHEAYLRLVGLWQSRVRAVAGGLVGTWRGEELARNAVAEAWRRLPTMPAGARFGPWLLGILREHATPAGAPTPAPAPLVGGHAGVAPRAVASQPALPDPLAAELLAALAELEAPQREAFLLAGVAGLAYDDVARILAVPPGDVAEAVYLARVRLAAGGVRAARVRR